MLTDGNRSGASMDPLELEVRHLVSKEAGVSIERIRATSRLQDDLGMDGDDAVEFFQAYERAFRVDISALWVEWSSHFGPEGGASPAILLLFAPGAIVAMTSIFIIETITGIPLSSWLRSLVVTVLTMVLSFAWARWSFWPLSQMFPSRLRQITVADLVEAARRGTW